MNTFENGNNNIKPLNTDQTKRRQTPDEEQQTLQKLKEYLLDGDIDKALELQKDFPLPEEILQQAVQERMKFLLPRGYTDKALELQKAFPLPEEVLQQAVQERMKFLLPRGYTDKALELQKAFPLPEEVLQQIVQEGMMFLLKQVRNFFHPGNYYLNEALELQKAFPLSEEMLQQAVQAGMKDLLSRGHVDDPLELQKTFPLSEEMLASREIQQAIQKGMKFLLSGGYTDEVLKLQKTFPLPEAFFSSPEIQETVQEGMKYLLSKGDADRALKLQKTFPLSAEMLASREIQRAVQEGMESLISNGYIDSVLRLQKIFLLPEEILQQAVQKGMKDLLSNGNINDALKLQEAFPLPEEILQQAVQKRMKYLLSRGYAYQSLELQKFFPLPAEMLASREIQQAVHEGIKDLLSRGNTDDTLDLQKAFPLPEEMLQQAVQESMKDLLSRGHTDKPLKLQKTFPLPETLLQEIAQPYIDAHDWITLASSAPLFSKSLKTVPFLGDIYKLQRPSNNADNDPWTKHLVPLLRYVRNEDTTALDNEATQSLILKYIKNFGMVFEPHLFDVTRGVIEGEEIPEQIKEELKEFHINPKLERNAILLELNKIATGYTTSILQGSVPDSIDTPLGHALFVTEFVPQSSWDRKITNWKKLGLESQKNYTVPSCFKRQDVTLLENKDMDDEQLRVMKQALLNNQETITKVKVFQGYIKDALEGYSLPQAQAGIQERITSQKALIEHKDPVKDAKIIASIENAIQKDEELLQSLEGIQPLMADQGAHSEELCTILTDLSAKRKDKEEHMNRMLRSHVLTQLLDTYPGLRTTCENLLQKETVDEESLRKLSDFTSHVIEHEYLDKKELSDAVKNKICSVLLASKIHETKGSSSSGLDYFTKVIKDLEQVSSPSSATLQSTVSFVPVGGLGRLTVGNVGDACHTSQTGALAQGKFQNTHMMMITKTSKDKREHIVGSVLGIEAHEQGSRTPVFVIRANNPQENYLSRVNVDSYAESSVQACIAQAVERRNANVSQGLRGDMKVCMPMEKKSNASMTNRSRIHEAMKKRFQSCEKVGLVSTEDTNFNEYTIWDAQSSHAVVCVYEIRGGKEYYYGEHGNKISHTLVPEKRGENG